MSIFGVVITNKENDCYKSLLILQSKIKNMKHSLLACAMLLSANLFAQDLPLKKGQKVDIIVTTNQEMDMSSMGMQMQNNTTTQTKVEVKDIVKDSIVSAITIARMQISVDMMGQQVNYDSDKPEDKDSEMGKDVGNRIGKELLVYSHKTTGKGRAEKDNTVKEADKNPLAGLMQSFGPADESATIENLFFLAAKGKKEGDTWTDTSSVNGNKESKTYTIKSIKDGITLVGLFTTMQTSTTTEAEGMQMDISMNVKTEGEFSLDSKSFMMKKSTSVSDIDGTIGVMGQSMPMSSKVTTSIEYK